MPGDETDVYVAARVALLDALEALGEHANEVVVIGAQAVYLHTGAADVAIAPFTIDGDLVIDPRSLGGEPLIEEAMRAAHFELDQTKGQPGAWVSREGIAVDLMVPEAVAGTAGRRGARIPPHSNRATRRAVGLEAAVVDHEPIQITGFPGDGRVITANVAGPAALLVAKLHKLAERREDPDRLFPKDAHDVYRLLVATDAGVMADALQMLRASSLASEVTEDAVRYLQDMFSSGPAALGSRMAGQAEASVGDPTLTAQACSFLASDVADALVAKE